MSENGCWNLSTNSVKSEPVCVFVNRNYDENSSDSEHLQEQPLTIDEEPTKSNGNNALPPYVDLLRHENLLFIFFPCRVSTPTSAAYRRGRICPICGEKNFSRLSHHLAITHNLDRQEILTLLTYTDQNNNNNNNTSNNPSIASVSGSSPTNTPSNAPDKSPQQTPISINTNNQQITCPSSPTSESDNQQINQTSLTTTTTTSSSPLEQQSSNYLPIDGKKRLLCPRCDTWVLNLTDHLIKKHHLISKQERLPFLRLARNRYATPSSTPTPLANGNEDKSSNNSFLISPDHSSSNTNEQQIQSQQNVSLIQQAANRKYQNIVKKYRKKLLGSMQTPSSSSLSNTNSTEKSAALASFDPSTLSLTAHDLSSAATLAANHNLLTMNSIQSLLTNGSNNLCKQEKFKFPNLNENFSSRNFSAIKTSSNNIKDQQQVGRRK